MLQFQLINIFYYYFSQGPLGGHRGDAPKENNEKHFPTDGGALS